MTRENEPRAATSTRRRVLGRVGAASGIVAASAAAGAARRAGSTADGDTGADDPVGALPLYDVHAHVVPAAALGRTHLTADDLVDWMDERGIDRAAVLALDSPESYPVAAPSWWVLEEAAAHPDRLLPFCTVDPRTLVYGEDEVAALIDRYVEAGARGFGELKPGVPIDDPRLEILYDLCAEYDLPILLHVDEKAMLDEVGLPGFEAVLGSYPDVDFIAHAPGWWAHISADVTEADIDGYPDRPVEPGGRVPELLADYDNLYGDLSAASGWNALDRDPAYGQTFLERHHEGLVFGTDYLYEGQDVPQFDLFERFDLERDRWANIRYRNFEAVLREP